MKTYRTKNILYFFAFLLLAAIVYVVTNSMIGILPAGAMGLAAIPLVNLDHQETDCNMAGISTIVYVAKKSDIKKYPDLAPNKVLPEDTVNLIGDFELNPGAFWRTFYSTQEMGEFKSEVQGNRDGEYFEISGSFFYPNTTPRALGLANIFKNTDVIIILKEFTGTGNGQMRVIGTMDLPARIKPAENSGKAFSDQKGITFNFTAKSCSVPYVYTGVILTEFSQINNPTPILATDTTIDGSLNSRFVFNDPNANQDVNIFNYINCQAGTIIRIEDNDQSANNYQLELHLADGGDIILQPGQWAELFFREDNVPVMLNTNA